MIKNHVIAFFFSLIFLSICSKFKYRFNYVDKCTGSSYFAHLYINENGTCIRDSNGTDYQFICQADGNLTNIEKFGADPLSSDNNWCEGVHKSTEKVELGKCSNFLRYECSQNLQPIYNEWSSRTWFFVIFRYDTATCLGRTTNPYVEVYPFEECFQDSGNNWYMVVGDRDGLHVNQYTSSACTTKTAYYQYVHSKDVVDGTCVSTDMQGFIGSGNKLFGMINSHKLCFGRNLDRPYFPDITSCSFLSSSVIPEPYRFSVGYIFLLLMTCDMCYGSSLILCCCCCFSVACITFSLGEAKKKKDKGKKYTSLKDSDELFDDVEEIVGIDDEHNINNNDMMNEAGQDDLTPAYPSDSDDNNNDFGGKMDFEIKSKKKKKKTGVIPDSSTSEDDSSSDGELMEGGNDLDDDDFDNDPMSNNNNRQQQQQQNNNNNNNNDSGFDGEEEEKKIHMKIIGKGARTLNVGLKVVKDFRSYNGLVSVISLLCVFLPTGLFLCNMFCCLLFFVLTIISFAAGWKIY